MSRGAYAWMLAALALLSYLADQGVEGAVFLTGAALLLGGDK